MDAADILLTFAEVSVALAGFIGITAALRMRSGNWAAWDISSIRFVLEVSLSALFLSVLPGILSNFPMDVSTAWRIAATVLTITLLLLVYFQSQRRRNLAAENPEGRAPLPFLPVMLAGYMAVTAGIAYSALSGIATEGAYLVGVAMLLLAAAIEFLAVVASLRE